MGNFILRNVYFGYEASHQSYVLEDINLNIDTSWKLGLLGKNGSGKTTLLNILLTKHANRGTVFSKEECIYFPMKLPNHFEGTVRQFYEWVLSDIEDWKLYVEFDQIGLNDNMLDKDYLSLSEGEKCKVQLVALFLDKYKFPLIDEPTNNLDLMGRKMVSNYLKQKSGFIISSHDEQFLNEVITHVIYIENKTINLFHGNVERFKVEREKQLKHLNDSQEKLRKEITHLSQVSQTFRHWADKREKETNDASSRRIAAKQMKRAKSVEKRTERKIKEKELLLKPINNDRVLKINVSANDRKITYLKLEDYSLYSKNKVDLLFSPISMQLSTGDVIWVKGKNGIGKTTFLKNLIHEQNDMSVGKFNNNVNSMSYISQNMLCIKDIHNKVEALDYQTREMFFFNLNLIGIRTTRLDFSSTRSWSMGEIKKIMIALSLVTPAKVFIWDEISNFLDMETLDKIIIAVKTYKPTILFVDHNEYFAKSIATKELLLD